MTEASAAIWRSKMKVLYGFKEARNSQKVSAGEAKILNSLKEAKQQNANN